MYIGTVIFFARKYSIFSDLFQILFQISKKKNSSTVVVYEIFTKYCTKYMYIVIAIFKVPVIKKQRKPVKLKGIACKKLVKL